MTFRDSDSCLQKNINDLHPVNDTPEPNSFSRRKFLVSGLLAGACAALPKSALAADASSSSKTAVDPQGPAYYTIRIGAGLVELADDRILSTTTYNGQFPGPLLRLKGVR
jgi:FtsP/CotA-like multicopper oxidase with cupredoxin domain